MRALSKEARDIELVLPAVDKDNSSICNAISEVKKQQEYDAAIDAKIKSAASWEFKLSKTFSF